MNKIILVTVVSIFGFLSCSIKPVIHYSKNLDKDKDYFVILLGGQSNMVGQGKITDLSSMKFKNINYINFGTSANLETYSHLFGPEVGISQKLSNSFPDKNFIVIKYAIGGASLLDWTPNYNMEKAKVTGHPEFGNMYKTLLQKVDSITSGYSTKIVALLWMQGERDARIPEAGKEYYENFKQFIDSLRVDLNSPQLPIIFGMINPPKSRYKAVDIVRLAQQQIHGDFKNTELLNTDDLEKWADSVHYSSNGQLKLGQRFGEQLTNIMNN